MEKLGHCIIYNFHHLGEVHQWICGRYLTTYDIKFKYISIDGACCIHIQKVIQKVIDSNSHVISSKYTKKKLQHFLFKSFG